tara:strand:+ start:528 stop:644 length:117 start_codon:yes stop_codon:yes gene_type:complete
MLEEFSDEFRISTNSLYWSDVTDIDLIEDGIFIDPRIE